MQTYELICEGRCNPNIGDIDRAISVAREKHQTAAGVLIDERLLNAVRRLIHTAHEPAGVDWYVCKTCGTPRRCGGTPWSVMAREQRF